jgi:hypothetical protein
LRQAKELAGGAVAEPLLTENKHRFVLFPIKHEKVRPSGVRRSGWVGNGLVLGLWGCETEHRACTGVMTRPARGRLAARVRQYGRE